MVTVLNVPVYLSVWYELTILQPLGAGRKTYKQLYASLAFILREALRMRVGECKVGDKRVVPSKPALPSGQCGSIVD